ncbi:MAG TPA: hypothetical protein VJ884_06550 [Salinibacter sp.]|nr:hypothetical protein [Salinibacter sp.]
MSLIRRLFLFLGMGMVGLLPVHAQSSYDLYGSARADALGNATTASVAASGVHANPATHGGKTEPTATFYAREGFGLSALRYGATHVAVPLSWGTVSGGASTFGFEDYREVHLSAGYARQFQFGTSRSVHVGLTTRYYHTSIARYGSAGTLGVNAGFILTVLRSLALGAHATNVTGSALTEGEPIPRTLAVGLRYQALEQMRVLVDVFKDVRFPTSVRGGLEVSPVSVLTLRAGITTTPVRFMGGIGVHLGPLRANLAAEQHQELGWSPSASLRVQW